ANDARSRNIGGRRPAADVAADAVVEIRGAKLLARVGPAQAALGVLAFFRQQIRIAEAWVVKLVEAWCDKARAVRRARLPACRQRVAVSQHAGGLRAELRVAIVAQVGLP